MTAADWTLALFLGAMLTLPIWWWRAAQGLNNTPEARAELAQHEAERKARADRLALSTHQMYADAGLRCHLGPFGCPHPSHAPRQESS